MTNRKSLFLVLAILLAGPLGYAQLPVGAISGTTRDASGAVTPGVAVKVASQSTGEVRTAATDNQGRYIIPNLRPGDYDVQASLTGFQTSTRKAVHVEIGGESRVDVEMQIGEVQQQVEVTGELPTVNTTNSEVSGLVEAEQVQSLPLNGRSFTDLLTLEPGVRYITAGATGSVSGQGKRISISGGRSTGNTFLLDGSDINDKNAVVPGSIAGVLLGVDTVAEFKVLANAYGAEYGTRAGGVVSAVTQAGSNQLHGKVFEYLRNSAIDARDFFDRDPRNPTRRSDPPPFKQNQYGFVVGGPVKQDRTFLFGSFEGLRQRLGRTLFGRVPTAAARAGALGPVDPGVVPFINIFPLPNGQDFGNGTAEYVLPQTIPTNEDYFLLRADHRLSEKYSLFGRYVLDDADKLNASDTGLFREALESRNQWFTLSTNQVLSARLINTAQIAYNRAKEFVSNPPGAQGFDLSRLEFLPGRGMGSLAVSGLSAIGVGATNPQKYITNNFQYFDNAVYVLGRHNMKFGGMFTRIQFNDFFGVRYTGAFAFANLNNFLRNEPQQFFGTIFSDPVRGVRQNLAALYVQDDFKLTDNLTLNLGLRYEFITVPTEVNGKISNLRNVLRDADFTVGDPYFQNPSKKNFAPRLGLAWDPFANGKTSVRAGVGVFYDEILPYYYRATVNFVPPFNITYRLTGAKLPLAWAPGQPLPAAERSVLGTLEYQTAQPYALQYNFTLEQQVGSGTSVVAGYRGYRGIKLLGITNVNQRIPTRIEADGRKFWDGDANGNPIAPRPNPNFTDLFIYPARDSWYNGLDIGVNRRFSSGMQFQFSYSYAKSIDTASGHSGTTNLTSATDFPQDQINPKGSEKALSGFDIRNYFRSNFIYDLPLAKNSTGLTKAVLGDWQVNGLLTLTDGSPVNINLTFNRSRSGNTGYADNNDRPNLKTGFSNNPQIGDPNQWYDRSAFELQPAGYFGNLAKNTVISPGLATFDFSLIKNFRLGESRNIEFRSEFFNLLNRANFGVPDRFIFVNATGVPSPTAGLIRSTSTSSRQIQFALKLSF
ncbi:MAG: hypothetical protein EXQ56_13090 [Acidobacteria bacterium]|nr:hypothetical protein [Acidobacteriota bacterium]